MAVCRRRARRPFSLRSRSLLLARTPETISPYAFMYRRYYNNKKVKSQGLRPPCADDNAAAYGKIKDRPDLPATLQLQFLRARFHYCL